MLMRHHAVPVTSKEFNYVMKSIANGIKQLMKSRIKRETPIITAPIMIDGIALNSYKCNNTFIKNVLQFQVGMSRADPQDRDRVPIRLFL